MSLVLFTALMFVRCPVSLTSIHVASDCTILHIYTLVLTCVYILLLFSLDKTRSLSAFRCLSSSISENLSMHYLSEKIATILSILPISTFSNGMKNQLQIHTQRVSSSRMICDSTVKLLFGRTLLLFGRLAFLFEKI